MLAREVVSKTKEIKETLHEIEAMLKCLNVEEKSIVIDSFVSVVKLFSEMLSPVAIDGKDKKEEDESSKEITTCLGNEIKYGLLHLITIEVLRLEVSLCYPDFLAEVPFIAVFQPKDDNVFKHKMNIISVKVNELKEMLSIQDEGPDNVHYQVLGLQVKDIWKKIELNPGDNAATYIKCFFTIKTL